MAFRNIFVVGEIVAISFIFMFFSCKKYQSPTYAGSATLDTIAFGGIFFANEEFIIKANDSIVLRQKIESLKSLKSVYYEFIVDNSDTVDISIEVFFEGKRTIDTLFVVLPSISINSIGGSVCYPSYLSEDSLRKIERPSFGFIPIDSCRRYFSIIPDSAMYRYPKD